MNRRLPPLLVGLLLLPLGCGGTEPGPLFVDQLTAPPPLLQPSELCSDQPGAAIPTFEDANLESRARGALGVGAQSDLTCGLMSE